MEQVNKLTDTVTQLTPSHNVNKLAARSTADPENSDNSDSGEDDEENDRVSIHETDRSLCNETDLENRHLRRKLRLYRLPLRKLSQKLHLKNC